MKVLKVSLVIGISMTFSFVFKTKCRVFSTGQALSFEELMRRVQPKQIVQRTRDEIIVKKMERIDGTMASVNDYFRHFNIEIFFIKK